MKNKSQNNELKEVKNSLTPFQIEKRELRKQLNKVEYMLISKCYWQTELISKQEKKVIQAIWELKRELK